METSKTLTTRDVAEVFKVTTETVRRWVNEGRITSWQSAGNLHLFDRAEVEQFQRERAKCK